MIYLLAFVVAFLSTYLLTPPVRSVALSFMIIDQTNHRKVHKKVITKLGGLAIFNGFVLAMIVSFFLEMHVLQSSLIPFIAIFISGVIILFLGIYDDVKGANAIVKFSVQIVSALILIKSGFLIDEIKTPFLTVSFGEGSIFFTILWVLGITNAINLIDGVDGLAAGIVLIVSLGLFAVLWLKQSSVLGMVMCMALAGSCLGFLQYNFHPAKIFMGDTGSLFLGFIISALAIESSCKSVVTISLLVPIIALGIPIFDTTFVFFRRLSKFSHPFRADDSHIHHCLLRRGFSQVNVVWILYSITILLSVIGLLFTLRFD